jgi:hypothetical protein
MDEWSDAELSATVDAYLGYLADEGAGLTPSKKALREQLLAGPLSGRTAGSYEYRMQNISAVLEKLGRPWIDGYKPAGNVGPTNTLKIRRLIQEGLGRSIPSEGAPLDGRIEPRHVYVANFGRENFEWPNCLAGSYIATMQDERAHELWAAGERERYIEFSMSTLKTARGLPPIRPVASRWFNLGTIVAESEGDLWFHRDGNTLWWTMTTNEPARFDREPDPSARAGDPETGIFYRKPARPWSNRTLKGNRLEWAALHPKTHDFFSTEATLQKLGPAYAGYAVALINGEEVRQWTEQPEWKAKVAARRGNSGGSVLNDRQRTIAMMARRAMQTARGANGQQELRRVKNKEFRFASQLEFEAYIDALWKSQEGLCALSGLSLQCEPAEDLEFCASLDRKDSDGHYEPDNLQVVCRFINRWKSDDENDNFLRLLTAVSGSVD